MSVILPYSFTAGTKAKASEVNANFSALASKFSEGVGGIADGDISSSAAIKGSKLSNVAGQRITTDRIEDLNITTAKLVNSSGTLDGVTTAKIADRAVTAIKIALSAILSGNLKYTRHQQSFTQVVSNVIAGGSRVTYTIAPSGGGAPGNISAHVPIYACLANVAGYATSAHIPTVAVSYDGSGNPSYLLQASGSGSTQTITGTINFFYLANS